MGKEWDSLKAPTGGASFQDTSIPGTGFKRLPNFTGNPNRTCANCGGSERGNDRKGGFKRCVCDAPRFPHMGTKQGKAMQAWHETWAREAFRILKPGGHLLAFGGTRTFHRLTVAIEDAGFEIRDCLSWLYGSGFPKSLDVSKAMDKAAGAEREVVGSAITGAAYTRADRRNADAGFESGQVLRDVTAPATPEAERWQGWGTALKPAWEPVIVARKPLIGTVAANVLTHGTGALNVDGCRIEAEHRPSFDYFETGSKRGFDGGIKGGARTGEVTTQGRWPANVVLDEDAAALLDQQSGERKSPNTYTRNADGFGSTSYRVGEPAGKESLNYGDTGGASRFFLTVKPDDDCWLCGGPKHGIINATQEDTTCVYVTSAESNSGLIGKHNGTVPNPALHELPHYGAARSDASLLPVEDVESRSRNTPETGESIVQPSADISTDRLLAQRVSDAGSLCDSCATGIAQSLAQAVAERSTQSLGLDSTRISNVSILNQSLVSFAEPWVSTGTIPTIESLSILFGYVRSAIRTSTENVESDRSLPLRFAYQSKASRSERNAGLEGMPERASRRHGDTGPSDNAKPNGQTALAETNHHPTVKPIALMRWLVRLVTPPGGLVLDPFAGSGSTGCAAVIEGFRFVGIEQDAEYAAIAERRIAYWESKRPTAIQPALALEGAAD